MQQTDDAGFDEMLDEIVKANPELYPQPLAEKMAQQDEALWQESRRENYKKWMKRRVIMEIDKLRILRGKIPPELLERGGELVTTLKREQDSSQEDDEIALRCASERGVRQALAEFATERDAYITTLKTLLKSRDIDSAFQALKEIYPMLASDLDRILANGADPKEPQA